MMSGNGVDGVGNGVHDDKNGVARHHFCYYLFRKHLLYLVNDRVHVLS
jgi:hypothetical protein